MRIGFRTLPSGNATRAIEIKTGLSPVHCRYLKPQSNSQKIVFLVTRYASLVTR